MNAASGAISFPPDKLEVISLSKTGSIFTLWVQEPLFSNSSGAVNFEGIALNPGFTGIGGKLITVNFKAKAAGAAVLNFSSGSVLANDGKGTNILANLGSAQFSLGRCVPRQLRRQVFPRRPLPLLFPAFFPRLKFLHRRIPTKPNGTPKRRKIYLAGSGWGDKSAVACRQNFARHSDRRVLAGNK